MVRPLVNLSLAEIRSVSKNLLLLISAGVIITLNVGEASAGRLDGFGKNTHKPRVLQFNRAAKNSFQQTIEDCRLAAAQVGVSEKTLNAALPYTLKIDNEVIKLDREQSGYKLGVKPKRKPKRNYWSPSFFKKYKPVFVSKKRIASGAKYLHHGRWSLPKVSKKYNVDAPVLTAIFGMETNFGRCKGKFNIIRSLVTLVHDGRRAKLFKKELISALKIVDAGYLPLKSLKGSWAGAMGGTQLMPSNYLKYAQDFNKDGKKDVLRTRSDALASAANLLSKNGWKKGAPFMEPVGLTHSFDQDLMGTHQKLTIDTWSDWGVKFKKKHKSPEDKNQYVSIIRLGGRWGQAYAVYDNFRVIKNVYNNTNDYAAAVGFLSQDIKKSLQDLRKKRKKRSHKTISKKRVNKRLEITPKIG